MAMEPKIVEQPSQFRPIPVYLAESPDREGEVSLIDIWRVIARRKGLALLGFGATVLLAVIYLLNAEPVYRATAHILPPQQQDIQGLQIRGLLVSNSESGSHDIEGYTPKYVFSIFLENLRSKGLRREFFDIHKLVNHYVSAKDAKDVIEDEVFEQRFSENLHVSADKNVSPLVTVSFVDTDSKLSAQWLNQFVDFANKRTIQQLFNDVNSTLQSEIKRIRDMLTSKLQLAEQRRLDRITTLKEALRVASVLGIKDASMFPTMADKASAGLAVNTAQIPLYMRGTDALETEISVIESRKSDEPFISGYRDLQERLNFVEAISIDQESLSAIKVDDPANVPYRAEKPRKKMIVALGIVLGIIIGVFMALAAEFLFGTRQES